MLPFPIPNFNWSWQHWHWQHFHIGNILKRLAPPRIRIRLAARAPAALSA
jgi:hypothetical protein